MATNGGSTTSRNYPDVAMVAVGLEVLFNGSFTEFNGTSAGAPLWAGFTALVNQANAQAGGPGKSGFLSPTIYDIGLTSRTADDLYSICFNDIVSGNNGAFTAVSGYDLCTGWGTPKGALINQLSSQTPLTNNQPLTLIRFVITTGQADLGGGLHGSGATATVALKNGDTFTVTLKTARVQLEQRIHQHVGLSYSGIGRSRKPDCPAHAVEWDFRRDHQSGAKQSGLERQQLGYRGPAGESVQSRQSPRLPA